MRFALRFLLAATGILSLVLPATADDLFPDKNLEAVVRKEVFEKRNNTMPLVEADLKKLFAPELWNRLHLQIIYFGREYCPARGHDEQKCPICSWTGIAIE